MDIELKYSRLTKLNTKGMTSDSITIFSVLCSGLSLFQQYTHTYIYIYKGHYKRNFK